MSRKEGNCNRTCKVVNVEQKSQVSLLLRILNNLAGPCLYLAGPCLYLAGPCLYLAGPCLYLAGPCLYLAGQQIHATVGTSASHLRRKQFARENQRMSMSSLREREKERKTRRGKHPLGSAVGLQMKYHSPVIGCSDCL